MPLPTADAAWSPPPADHRASGGEAGERSYFSRDAAADLARFVTGGEKSSVYAHGVGQIKGPAAVNHVEERGTGGIGNFRGKFAGQAESDVVLGKQDFPDPFVLGRFIVTDPEEFGQREAGEHGVRDAGEDLRFAHRLVDPIDLRLAALIAPDEGGANYAVGIIKDDEAVHLAGKPDALDLRAGDAGLRKNPADGGHRRVPPVLRALFGPKRLVLHHVLMRHRMGRYNPTVAIYQQRTAAARPNINSEPHSSYCFMRAVTRRTAGRRLRRGRLQYPVRP